MKSCPMCHREFVKTKMSCASCHKNIKKKHRWRVVGSEVRHVDCSNPTMQKLCEEKLNGLPCVLVDDHAPQPHVTQNGVTWSVSLYEAQEMVVDLTIGLWVNTKDEDELVEMFGETESARMPFQFDSHCLVPPPLPKGIYDYPLMLMDYATLISGVPPVSSGSIGRDIYFGDKLDDEHRPASWHHGVTVTPGCELVVIPKEKENLNA